VLLRVKHNDGDFGLHLGVKIEGARLEKKNYKEYNV